jgi:hypothetical protein
MERNVSLLKRTRLALGFAGVDKFIAGLAPVGGRPPSGSTGHLEFRKV